MAAGECVRLAEVGRLHPAAAQRLEVGVCGVGYGGGAPKVGFSERALVEGGDVRRPPATLRDDTLGVATKDVAPVGGTANAERLAAELGRVESECGGDGPSEVASVLG